MIVVGFLGVFAVGRVTDGSKEKEKDAVLIEEVDEAPQTISLF